MGTCYTLKFNKSAETNDYKEMMQEYKQSMAKMFREKRMASQKDQNNTTYMTQDSLNETIQRKKELKSKLQLNFKLQGIFRQHTKLEDKFLRLKLQLEPRIIFKEDGIYSNYALQVFKQENNDIQSIRNQIRDRTQIIIETSKIQMTDEYITCGLNIDEILCDLLNLRSKKFMRFCILDQKKDNQVADEIKKVDFKMVAYNNANEKKHLEVKFFISDIHNNNQKLMNVINKAQTYKVLQRVFPFKIHEEIFEIQSQNIKDLVRYCVIYEYETKEFNNQHSLQEIGNVWLENVKDPQEEQFSLEKVAYYFVQLLQHLVFLQSHGIYAYLEISDKQLVVNQHQELLIKSDFSQSFKLKHIRLSNTEEIEKINLQLRSFKQEKTLDFESRLNPQSLIQQNMFLKLDLFKQDLNQYNLSQLVDSEYKPEYNSRLQVSLIFSSFIEQFQEYLDTPILKSMIISQGFEKQIVMIDNDRNDMNSYQAKQSDYFVRMNLSEQDNQKEEEYHQLQNQLQYQVQLKNLLNRAINQLKDKSIIELKLAPFLSQILIQLNENKVFLNLIQQFYKEKKFLACTFMYNLLQDVLNLQPNQSSNLNSSFQSMGHISFSSGYFINKFYIMLYTLRSQIKLQNIKEAQQLFSDLEEFYKLHVNDASMSFKYQKEELLVQYEEARLQLLSGDLNKALESISKVYQTNVRKYSENNKLATKCISLQFKCHSQLKDYEKVIKCLQTKLAIQMRIQSQNTNTRQIGKTFYQMGITYKKFNMLEQALFYVEKAHNTFAKVMGEISIQTLEILKELSQLQMKNGDYQTALKNNLFLLNQHTFSYNSYHVLIYQDNRFIAECALKTLQFELAQFHVKQCQSIAEKIFVIIENQGSLNKNGKLADKDSVFESLDLENEQYSFLNYLQALINQEGFKDFEKAETHFLTAQKHIFKISNQSSQAEYIAQLYHQSGMNFIKLKKLEKARINLEYAVEYFEAQNPMSDQDLSFYQTTRKIYFSLIHVKRDQGNIIPAEITSNNFVRYVKSVILMLSKSKLDTKDLEYDLVKAYDIQLSFLKLKDFKQNFEGEQIEFFVSKIETDKIQRGNKIGLSIEVEKKAEKSIAKQIEDIYLDQKRIYERRLKEFLETLKTSFNNQHLQQINQEYQRLIINTSKFYMEVGQYKKAVEFCLLAKDQYAKFRQKDDYNKLFEITNNLAQAYNKCQMNEEAMTQFKMVLQYQDTYYRDIFNSMSAYDAYDYYKEIGELFERNQKYKEAGLRYEKCLTLLEELFDEDKQEAKDKQINERILMLTSIAYCYNIAGAFEVALEYQKKLHEINVTQFSLNHPNTLNSTFAQIRLIQKLKYNHTLDLRNLMNKLKESSIYIIVALCDRFKHLPIIKFFNQNQTNPNDFSVLSFVTLNNNNNTSHMQENTVFVEQQNEQLLGELSEQGQLKYEQDLDDYLLFKSYITSEPNIQLLNDEYRPDKNTDFNFLKQYIELDFDKLTLQKAELQAFLDKKIQSAIINEVNEIVQKDDQHQEIVENQSNQQKNLLDDLDISKIEKSGFDQEIDQSKNEDLIQKDEKKQQEDEEQRLQFKEEWFEDLDLEKLTSIQRLFKIFQKIKLKKEKQQVKKEKKKQDTLIQQNNLLTRQRLRKFQ